MFVRAFIFVCVGSVYVRRLYVIMCVFALSVLPIGHASFFAAYFVFAAA